jgi:hypothetical protein
MARERRTIPMMRDLSAAARNCPLAPPQHASVYSRALHRACLIIGGADKLAEHLKVGAPQVQRWLLAEEMPPESAFLECVEIILLYASGGANQPGN